MIFIAVRCPYCQSDQIVQRGKTRRSIQRYLYHNTACIPQSFLLEYRYQGRLPEGKQQIISMRLNASGVGGTGTGFPPRPPSLGPGIKPNARGLGTGNTPPPRPPDPHQDPPGNP